MIKSENRFLRWADRNWFPGLIALGLGVPPMWGLVLNSSPPMAILHATAPDPNVPRGGALVLRYEVDRWNICPGEIQRMIVDGQGVLHLIERYEILADQPDAKTPNLDEPAPSSAPPPQLGRHVLTVSAPVPAGAAPGKARYQGVVHYYCNWVRRMLNMPVDVRTPVIEFTITEAELEKPTTPLRLPNAAPGVPTPSVPELAPKRKRSDLGPMLEPIPTGL